PLKVFLFIGIFWMGETRLQAGSWEVRKETDLADIKKAVALARDYDTLFIYEGLYLENLIEINKPLSIIGINDPVIDSEGGDEIFVVTSDDVLILGLTLKNIGVSFIKDRAAIKLIEVKGAVIEQNHLLNAFFGI